jgi:hypothetical protein
MNVIRAIKSWFEDVWVGEATVVAEHKKAKGIPQRVVKTQIKHQQGVDCVLRRDERYG